MIDPNTGKHPNIIPNQTVYMLHFEYYPTESTIPPPNNTGDEPYRRRRDLKDPLQILQEGYRSTFEETTSDDDRINITQLTLSEDGRKFIKDWESFKSKAYNDSEGYCTVGYGHLIARAKCEDINVPEEFKNGISIERADELFETRLPTYVSALKNSISADLYQYEFDALVCLLFNLGSFTKAPKLKEKLNNHEYNSAADEFLDITNGGVAGLVSRRNSERNLFLRGVYDSTH